MKTKRDYVMRDRAEQVERTRDAILASVVALAYTTPLSLLTLERVGRQAGVSVQTVLRQFGSREALLESANAWATRVVLDERPADPAQFEASFEALIDHYELRGDGVLLLLGQESWEPVAREATAGGKALHRDWVERLFAPQLAQAIDPDALTDQLVVVTDVYAWKLLRRDRGLDLATTARRMRGLVDAVLAANDASPAGTPARTAQTPRTERHRHATHPLHRRRGRRQRAADRRRRERPRGTRTRRPHRRHPAPPGSTLGRRHPDHPPREPRRLPSYGEVDDAPHHRGLRRARRLARHSG
ncbi:TetR/AcrR family transcriptional regulator [Agromyces protaetiae]|nr:TetR/AcrR family transcriptional regulator [Agromyces protaetiae]